MRKQVTFFSFMVLAGSLHVFAQTGVSVASFTANPTSIPSAYSSVFTWDTVGGYGANIYLYCPDGVTVKDEQGNSVSCNTAIGVGAASSGSSVAYTFFNFSGTTKSVNVRLIPKDVSGTEQISSMSNITVTVGALAQPITDFTASTISPKSGDTVTLSWKGVYISGVNLQFDCVDSLRLWTTDSSPTEIICGKPLSSSDLPATGSYGLKIANATYAPASIRVTVLPSQGGGLYDATKSLSLTFTVGGQSAPVSPSVTSFTSSKSSVYSDEAFDLYWSVANAKGTNMQFQCGQPAPIVSAVVGTTTTPLPCNAPAFSTALSSSGTTTVSISNKDFFSLYANVSVVLLPQQNDGTYTALNSRTLALRVMPGSAPSSVKTPTPVATSTQSLGIQSTVQANKTTFTLSLGRGSRGSQVTALQEFLAKNKAIYPEGLVTGFFGAASEMAVKRFQERYGIAKQGDAGYGYVGPKTRIKLNSLTAP